SEATNPALAVSSAMIKSSLGPAGISMAIPYFVAICLATVTNWLPGPNILYTGGMVSVPKVMPAMACMPPTLYILVIPHRLAAYKMAGCTFPSLLGGVQRTISLQPAMLAGMANINMVENNGAVPPGIYNPI